jgi:Fe-Mn family superoxide dismutase
MYQAKNYDILIGTEGFSEKLLTTHFTLYQGYVTNTNKLADQLRTLLDSDMTTSPEYAEITRRFGWEFNGMRLHEYYFENMKNGGAALAAGSPLHSALTQQFGTFENWQKDFIATGALRGIGWAILYYDPLADRYFNCWVNEHDTGHLTGCIPLLVMDVFEHAFIIDYGTKRADYIQSFIKAIDWNKIDERRMTLIKSATV